MELERALHQISEIHGHLARSEVYRGYRSLPLAISALVAFAAAALQIFVLAPASGLELIRFWVLTGALCGALSSSEIAYNYVFREDAFLRRRTRRVVGQFVPCLVAGAVVTVLVCRGAEDFGTRAVVLLLPGFWAILFSMGILASRPYLPRAIGWVGLYYLVAGAWLLLRSAAGLAFFSWAMGVVFGTGQLLFAVVLYWNVERKDWNVERNVHG